MRMWIAAASIAVTLAAPSLRAQQQCDPQSLVCAAPAASESFLDLMSNGAQAAEAPVALVARDRAPAITDAPEATSRPAVYMGRQAVDALPAAAAGMAALNPAANGFSSGAMSGWLALPTLAAQPAPSFAWVLALGFLGLIVLRRTRASRD